MLFSQQSILQWLQAIAVEPLYERRTYLGHSLVACVKGDKTESKLQDCAITKACSWIMTLEF